MGAGLRRKAGTLWNPKPTDRVRRDGPTEAELAETLHRHSCSTCSSTYEDACLRPMTNRSCTGCRGRTPPIWELGLRPKACCSESQPATPQEMTTYRLGGDTPWWLCPKCKRPHSYKPRKAQQ